MKSGISWGKLLHQFWKRQTWVFALSCTGAFLSWPVLFMMQLSNLEETYARQGYRLPLKEWLSRAVCNSLGSGMHGCVIAFGAVVVAVLAAWSGFAVLHSREKTDLLHGLPVRREKVFALKTVIAALDIAVPAAAGCLCVLILAAARGLMSGELIAAALRAACVCFVYGMATWATAALAMLLTGQLLVGALGTAVLVGIGPLLALLCKSYAETFYSTYYPASRFTEGALWRYTSPVLGALYAAASGSPLLPAAALTVLLLALALAVYRIRPSEAAGRAMAFRLPAEGIAVVLCFTGAITSGIFFRTAGWTQSDPWFVFGLCFGLALVWAVVRVIYSMDIRRVFTHGATLALAAALTCAFVAYFRLDLAGFDAYLPVRDSVRSIAVLPGAEYEMLDSSVKWQSRLEHTGLGCDDALYAFLTKLTAEHEKNGDGSTELPDNGKPTDYRVPVVVRVELENGRWYTRCYWMRFSDVSEEMASLYGREAYLDALYPIRKLEDEAVGGLSVESSRGRSDPLTLRYDREAIGRILAALREDCLTLTPESVKTQAPVAVIHADLDLSPLGLETDRTAWIDEEGNLEKYIWSESLMVWPGFTRTIEAIESAGIEIGAHPSANSIREVTVYDNGQEETETITDRETLEKLAPRMVAREAVTRWMRIQTDCFASAALRTGQGFMEYQDFMLLEDH